MTNDEIITLFSESNEEGLIKEFTESKDFSYKTDDGWNLPQLCAYYNMPNLFKILSESMSFEDFNKGLNPIFIALEEQNFDFISQIHTQIRAGKIDLKAKEKSGENLLHMSIYYGNIEFAKELYELKVSAFEPNNRGETAINMAIKKNYLELFDLLNDPNVLLEKYNESYIQDSIRVDSEKIFERLLPITNLTPDELFELSSGFSSIKVLNNLLKSGDIIPGIQQLTSIINLISKNYDSDPSSLDAAVELTDYLFSIKTPFSRFSNEDGQSAWMLCILNNNERVFERLIASQESANVTDSQNHTPLFYAIEKNKPNMVKLLLDNKANPNHVDNVGNSPLIRAVEIGNETIVSALLKHGANVNHKNQNNENSLSLAIKKRRIDIVSNLIWNGGEISTNPAKFFEEKSFMQIGASGQAERFSYHEESQIDNFVALSKIGFDLEQKNDVGDSLIHHFIKNGYMANFYAIIKCLNNPNQIDSEGNSPIMLSCQKNQDVYFNTLTDRYSNLDLTVTNANNQTVYDLCIISNKVKNLEKLILLDKEITSETIRTPLKCISKDGDLSAIGAKILTDKLKINLNDIDENGNNLLMYSLAGGNLKNIKWLVEEAKVLVDLDRENKYGHSLKKMIDAIPNPELKADVNYILKKNVLKP